MAEGKPRSTEAFMKPYDEADSYMKEVIEEDLPVVPMDSLLDGKANNELQKLANLFSDTPDMQTMIFVDYSLPAAPEPKRKLCMISTPNRRIRLGEEIPQYFTTAKEIGREIGATLEPKGISYQHLPLFDPSLSLPQTVAEEFVSVLDDRDSLSKGEFVLQEFMSRAKDVQWNGATGFVRGVDGTVSPITSWDQQISTT